MMYCRKFKCLHLVTLLQFLIIFHMGDSLKNASNPDLPPKEFPTDNTTYKIISKNNSLLEQMAKIITPHEFPREGSNFTIITNPSLLKAFTSKQNNGSEVADLLKTKLITRLSDKKELVTDAIEKEPSTTGTSTTIHDPDLDAEYVTKSNNLTKSYSDVHKDHDHLHRGGGSLMQGQLAAILAGVFAIIAVFCYLGLLTWRRYLEHRYGNRELLVNENEYYSYSDMKTFEL